MSRAMTRAETRAEPEERYWSPAELADRLRLAPGTLKNWRLRGQGPRWVKIGARVRYPDSEVARWEANRARQG